jgi:hypothetical protein
VPFDLLHVEIQLREQQSDHRSFQAFVASSVERVRVGQEVERQVEELAAAGKLAGGVSQLCFGGSTFAGDGRELGLELVAWPVWLVEQFKVAIFLGVKLSEADVQALAKIHCGLKLVRHGVVYLATQHLLEMSGKTNSGEVLFDGVFDLGEGEEGEVTATLLATAAEEVEVAAAVALCLGNDETAAAAVAPHEPFEPVVMFALPGAGAAVQGQHPLDAVVGLFGDQGLVPAGVFDAVKADFADVVAIGEHVVEMAQ